MTHTAQEQQPRTTTEHARTGPILPAARKLGAAHDDFTDWPPERYEPYAELGGIQ